MAHGEGRRAWDKVGDTNMSGNCVQIGGVEYNYHGSYRMRYFAEREASKLVKQGYKVKITEFRSYEEVVDLFDVLPKRFDVFKRQGESMQTGQERPLPETYSDWVNLAMDIKEKSLDVGIMARVNTALTAISEDQPSAEEAKRWLVSKAGELGII